jgi:hypothetical protein
MYVHMKKDRQLKQKTKEKEHKDVGKEVGRDRGRGVRVVGRGREDGRERRTEEARGIEK